MPLGGKMEDSFGHEELRKKTGGSLDMSFHTAIPKSDFVRGGVGGDRLRSGGGKAGCGVSSRATGVSCSRTSSSSRAPLVVDARGTAHG